MFAKATRVKKQQDEVINSGLLKRQLAPDHISSLQGMDIKERDLVLRTVDWSRVPQRMPVRQISDNSRKVPDKRLTGRPCEFESES